MATMIFTGKAIMGDMDGPNSSTLSMFDPDEPALLRLGRVIAEYPEVIAFRHDKWPERMTAIVDLEEVTDYVLVEDEDDLCLLPGFQPCDQQSRLNGDG